MSKTSAREEILNKVKQNLQTKTNMPFPEVADDNTSVFHTSKKNIIEHFAIEFQALGGKFIYNETKEELVENLILAADEYDWKEVYCHDEKLNNWLNLSQLEFIKSTNPLPDKFDAAITTCNDVIARTGSLVITSANASGRVLPIYCPIHIVIATPDQFVWDLSDITPKYSHDANLPSMINIATGPSRTADIEKTLVVGVHGPKEVYVFLLDQHQH